MKSKEIWIKTGKDIVASEITALRHAINGAGKRHTDADIEHGIEAYPFTATARNQNGKLIGYVSAFSDELLTTLIGELLVHPNYDHRSIGAALVERVEQRYPGVPVHTLCPDEQLRFFTRLGFSSQEKEMRVVSKTRRSISESVIVWAAM